MSEQSVILFPTSAHVMHAEKLFNDAGISCRLVPVPRHLSSDCGICLVISRQESTDARVLLEAMHVEYDALADMDCM